MACSNCNTQTCGCASGTYVVSQTCPPACSEVFNSSCIVYTGVDITCTDEISGLVSTVVSRNDYLDTIITNIVNFMCNRLNPAYLPSSVVDSGDAYIVVTPATVGYVTTYTVTLDPSTLPSASLLQDGVNTVVTGDGSALTPYEVNSIESIVEVTPGTALSVSTSSTGPYENTYTIDIDTGLLPITDLSSLWGYISITPIPNTPNAGDTTFQLDVDQVTVDATDTRLVSTLTSPGGAPANFLRTFDLTVDDTVMGAWIMDSVVNNTNPLTAPGLIAGAGIVLSFDPVLHQIEITSTFTDPDRWDELIDFAGNNIFPNLPTSTLTISADSVTDGISAVLSGIPSAAVFTLVNTDKGSDQLIFGTVAVSGQPNVLAATNTDTLTLVEGANIGLTTDAILKTVTIVNEIDHVYSDVIADNLVSLQAGSTTSTLEIIGGTGITTSGVMGANAEVTITNDSPNVDQFIWETIDSDAGSTVANTTTDTLTVSGGVAIDTSIAGDVLTIDNVGVTSAVAGDGISVSGATGAVTITADVQRAVLDSTTNPLELPYTAAAPAQTITHALSETYVNVRVFDGLNDVTNQGAVIVMVTNATFTVQHPTRNITDVLVIG